MRLILAALVLILPLPALAHDYRIGTLSIAHPTAPETPPTARSAAGYLSISNEGDEADALVTIGSEMPSASIHRSEVVDGIATMSPVERLEIPARRTVTFEPGGLHVMFMGLDAPLTAGGRLPATLVFERAGPMKSSSMSSPAGEAPSMGRNMITIEVGQRRGREVGMPRICRTARGAGVQDRPRPRPVTWRDRISPRSPEAARFGDSPSRVPKSCSTPPSR